MVFINIEERRAFFQEFECQPLTADTENALLIKNFKSVNSKDDLQDYLVNTSRAWQEDLDGETRVYLIKDKTGNIACYFSIKCGLIVGDDLNVHLSDDERTILELYVEAKKNGDTEAEENLFAAINSSFPERADELFKIALKKLDRKTEAMEIGQSQSTINVPICYSAIELRHLCRNANYKLDESIGVPLGFGLFWEKIVPIIENISNMIGCKYVYLFAADDSRKVDGNVKKLVRYYKNDFKFYECDESVKLVKPDYDNFCYGLIQRVSDLKKNRNAIWEEFSDVWE